MKKRKKNKTTLVTPNTEDMLLIKMSLHATKVPYEDSQREAISSTLQTTRCKVCGLIIDGGSCTNLASKTLIDKLQILTKEHLAPYSFQWLRPSNAVTTSSEAVISFSIGPIVVRCYVMPFVWMHLSCFLVGHGCMITT